MTKKKKKHPFNNDENILKGENQRIFIFLHNKLIQFNLINKLIQFNLSPRNVTKSICFCADTLHFIASVRSVLLVAKIALRNLTRVVYVVHFQLTCWLVIEESIVEMLLGGINTAQLTQSHFNLFALYLYYKNIHSLNNIVISCGIGFPFFQFLVWVVKLKQMSQTNIEKLWTVCLIRKP